MEKFKITPKEKEYFDYLNRLRVSGVTNMYGASPYLSNEFGLSKIEAKRYLILWMENFNPEGYEDLVK